MKKLLLPKIIINSYHYLPTEKIMTDRIVAFAESALSNGYEPIVVTYLDPSELSKVNNYEKIDDNVILTSDFDYPVYYILKKKNQTGFWGQLRMRYFYQFGPMTMGIWGLNRHKKLLLELSKENDIDIIFYSVNPFQFIGLGARVHKINQVPWFIDYRDDWTTNKNFSGNIIRKFLQFINHYIETNYTKTISGFSTVSHPYLEKISSLIQKEGISVENGFNPWRYDGFVQKPSEKFNLTYVGSLYPSQKEDILIDGVLNLLQRRPDVKITVNFVGLKEQTKDYKNILGTIPEDKREYFNFTYRVPKSEAIQYQLDSDVLVQFAYTGNTGIPGSKLYEYIALEKPVLLVPSDNGVLEETLERTGQLVKAENSKEVEFQIERLYQLWENNGHTITIDPDIKSTYTREAQSQKVFDYFVENLNLPAKPLPPKN